MLVKIRLKQHSGSRTFMKKTAPFDRLFLDILHLGSRVNLTYSLFYLKHERILKASLKHQFIVANIIIINCYLNLDKIT